MFRELSALPGWGKSGRASADSGCAPDRFCAGCGMPRVLRPLWRDFSSAGDAIRHARRGGLAVVGRRVLGAIGRPLLIEWAAIALEGPEWRARPALGVVEARIP